MIQWIFGLFCLVTFAVGALTLHSTQGSLRHLRAVTQAKAMSSRVSRAVPAAPHEAISRPVHRTPGTATSTDDRAEAARDGLEPLDVALLGTSVEAQPSGSLAMIKDGRSGLRRTYRLGEAVQGRTLVAIERGFISLRSAQAEERVELEDGAVAPADSADQQVEAWRQITAQMTAPLTEQTTMDRDALKAAIRPVSETERIVDRQAAWRAVKADPLQAMREASARPVFEDGRLTGIAMANVPDDGVLQQSGFRSGDVIRRVNGEPVTNPVTLLQMPRHVQEGGVIRVEVERNGQPLTLTFRLQ